MYVSDILAEKGDLVVTIHPDVTLHHAARQLARFGFGVLVASENGSSIAGIISERDIVRRVAENGPDALTISVRSVMTRSIHTCAAADTIDHVMELMTEHGFRHVPVVEPGTDGGQLCGMVSITDVVRRRVQELEHARSQLEEYLTAR